VRAKPHPYSQVPGSPTHGYAADWTPATDSIHLDLRPPPRFCADLLGCAAPSASSLRSSGHSTSSQSLSSYLICQLRSDKAFCCNVTTEFAADASHRTAVAAM